MIRDASKEKVAEVRVAMQLYLAEGGIDLARLGVIMGLSSWFKGGRRQDTRYIECDDISTSFRYIVERDFSGLIKDFSQGNGVSPLSRAGSTSILKNYIERQEALEQKMTDECFKLSVNYPKLAWVLNDFVSQLASHMGWDEIIDECVSGIMAEWKGSKQSKKEYAINALVGDRIFGELDWLPDGAEFKESKKCASFLRTYFSTIKTDDICFF